ncbi:NADH:flavin oxidoreductase [Sphingomonas sp. MM-1]|uniref:oxidoreductase n=1 Tax=Sphingomonas sp. MM-1 TaxID=745310 RepID=UPI0002C0764A|nr:MULTISPECIES: NADH:flavin oxidoreductase [unclassified Sphingomonas]AGH48121.1 NADH:flavin oxidoreductase [Sphingomonas sp. MM-1]MDX3884437.1 12-oxophytodienoate reductase [Sphingomonas sp.]
MSASPLFRPFDHPKLKLRNRIVMAPMTRKRSPGGVPGADVAAYYRRRGEGGVGLILSEGAGIRRNGSRSDPAVPNLFGDDALAGWQAVVDGVKATGAKFAPQLWHVGARPDEATKALPEAPIDSPSGLPWPGKTVAEPMSEEAIADTIAAYAEAAANAAKLGCDAVEIHGAHGYLIDQFLWDGTNLRSDGWNGPTLKERARFAAEVVRAMRQATGPDFPILIRISQDKSPDGSVRLANDPGELALLVEVLAEAGVDIFHCSGARFSRREFAGSDLSFAGWVKKISGLPTIAVGTVGLDVPPATPLFATIAPGPIDEVERRLDAGEFDLVAVGRALLADPDWAEKVRAGRTDELIGFEARYVAELH